MCLGNTRILPIFVAPKVIHMRPQDISIDQFDYTLPAERIAQHPIACRDACKLLVYRCGGEPSETVFSRLPQLLPPDSVLVYNNTRVINARVRMYKDTGALIEIFCLEPVSPSDYARNFESTHSCDWACFVGNSKRWKSGVLATDVRVGDVDVHLTAERLSIEGNTSVVRFAWTGGATFADIIEAIGEIPIPPYLNRSTEDSDKTDYQTVYSHINGSVAAPTAGLHFTPALLQEIDRAGIERLEVTLHVGAGTFQPVKADNIGDHAMHSEFIAVDIATIERLAAAVTENRPVIAVGTTSVRTLESLYHIGCMMSAGEWCGEVPQWYPYSGGHPCLSAPESLSVVLSRMRDAGVSTLIASTRIIIAPGYDYKIVDGMVTNFHQPRSTLLLLVSAFTGGERWRGLYDFAMANDFRFLSYGDACLLLK